MLFHLLPLSFICFLELSVVIRATLRQKANINSVRIPRFQQVKEVPVFVLTGRRSGAAVYRCPIKKLFRKILQTSQNHLCWISFKKAVRHKYFPVTFVKFHKAASCRTTLSGCFCTLRGVIKNVLEINK